jgi:uncharacterized protein (DUF58 family)
MKLDIQEIRTFGNIELLARQLVEGFITGLHKSPYHGFSVEFAEHKPYNIGESTRNIDWKVYARTDRLFTKRFEEETNLRCNILIDHSSSMYYPLPNYDKITFSLMAAAALAYILQKQRDAVGLCTFSDEIEMQTQVKSTSAHLHKIFLALEKTLRQKEPNKKTSIPGVLHQIANKIHKRSLVIIFSDLFDNEQHTKEILSALHHLKHNNHEVLLFHVRDSATELNFSFDDRPHIFIDLETNEKLKLHPAQVKEAYTASVQRHFHDLKMKCGQFKIDFIDADVREPLDKILMAYLIKRMKMR